MAPGGMRIASLICGLLALVASSTVPSGVFVKSVFHTSTKIATGRGNPFAPNRWRWRPRVASQNLLSNVFGSNMVFQADAPITVWGFVPEGTLVEVSLSGGPSGSGVGDANGMWRVTLPPRPIGGPFNMTVSTATANATLVNVMIGTVLLCSGQSNLSGATTPLSYLFNASASIAEADAFPQVRLFTVGEQATQGLLPPQRQLGFTPVLPWSVASSSTASGFSGACWMTGKVLARALGPAHPIGLIETAWSGTCIQAWLPGEVMMAGAPKRSCLLTMLGLWRSCLPDEASSSCNHVVMPPCRTCFGILRTPAPSAGMANEQHAF